MSKYKIMYSPAAYADLDNIVSYLIDHFEDRKAAKNLSDAIRSKVRSLDDMPERFAQVEWEPWASMNMHRFPIKNYIVFYLVDNDRKLVTVARIFYGGQDIENIIKNSELNNY